MFSAGRRVPAQGLRDGRWPYALAAAGATVTGIEGRSEHIDRFDVGTNLGVFNHTMEHYRILKQMVALRPRLIVIDSVFNLAKRPIITLRTEDTSLERASIAQHEGQAEAPVGRIREPVKDYFVQPRNNLQRFTCFVRPA